VKVQYFCVLSVSSAGLNLTLCSVTLRDTNRPTACRQRDIFQLEVVLNPYEVYEWCYVFYQLW